MDDRTINDLKEEIEYLKSLLVQSANEISIDPDFKADSTETYRLLRNIKSIVGDKFPIGIYIGEDEDFQ